MANLQPENVPTLTNASIPTVVHSDSEPGTGYGNVVAKPLAEPGFTNIKLKNQNIRLRGVNRLAGEGLSMMRHEALGFRYVVEADLDGRPLGWAFRDGRFMNGDLILMCIDRGLYDGALKYNEQAALSRVSRKAHEQQGRSLLNSALDEVPATPSLRSKISLFSPPDEQVAALLGR
jgi:hypothetical protein